MSIPLFDSFFHTPVFPWGAPSRAAILPAWFLRPTTHLPCLWLAPTLSLFSLSFVLFPSSLTSLSLSLSPLSLPHLPTLTVFTDSYSFSLFFCILVCQLNCHRFFVFYFFSCSFPSFFFPLPSLFLPTHHPPVSLLLPIVGSGSAHHTTTKNPPSQDLSLCLFFNIWQTAD